MTSLFTSVILCKEIYVVKTEKRRDKVTQQRMRSLDASFYHFPIRKSWPIRHMFRLQCTLSFIYIMLATKERNVQRTKRPKNESSRVRIVLRTKRPGNETSWERNVLLPRGLSGCGLWQRRSIKVISLDCGLYLFYYLDGLYQRY